MATGNIDLYKIYGDEYIPHKTPQFVRNLAAKYLTVSGKGEPMGDAFMSKMDVLFELALTVQQSKKQAGHDYVLCLMEAIWWGSRKEANLDAEPPTEWNWKQLLRVPHVVTEEDRMTTIMNLMDMGGNPLVSEVKLESIKEGLCIQMLHAGERETMKQTIDQIVAFAEQRKVQIHGLRHEIYVTDPRQTPPGEMETIIRFPVV